MSASPSTALRHPIGVVSRRTGLKPDLIRAKQVLGWKPTVSRKEGLTNLIEDFRRRGVRKN